MSNVLMQLKKILDAKSSIKQFKEFLGSLSAGELHDNHFNSETGNYASVLNYLVEKHSEPNNLLYHCAAVLEAGVDVNKYQSLHLAFRLRKESIARLFLTGEAFVCVEPELHDEDDISIVDEEDDISIAIGQAQLQPKKLLVKLDLDARDIKDGKTLMATVLGTKSDELLRLLLEKSPDLNNQPSRCEGYFSGLDVFSEVLPLHQAILQGYTFATQLLINSGGDISKACLKNDYTPILLAAKTGAIDSMKCLLKADSQKVIAEVTADGQSAVDLLCERLQKNYNSENALKGLALLFFHGASAPKLPQHLELLMTHRKSLVRELRGCKASVDRSPVEFMRKIHCQTDTLHQLFFEQSGFSSLIQHCMFKPSTISSKLESLISLDDENFSQDERYFADFTKRYAAEIKTRNFFNPFKTYNPLSTTRWNLAEGKLQTWQQVLEYEAANPTTRTAAIVREMLGKPIELSHDLHGSSQESLIQPD